MNNPYRAHSLFSINTHFFYDCILSIDRQPSSLYRSHNNEPCLSFLHSSCFIHSIVSLLYTQSNNDSTVILNIHIRLQITKHASTVIKEITKHASTVIKAAWFLLLFYVQSSGLSKSWFCCHFHFSLSNNYKSSGNSILFDPNLMIVKYVHICSNSYWIVSRITLTYKTKNPSLHFRHFCSLFTRLEVGNCVHLSISFSQSNPGYPSVDERHHQMVYALLC